MFKKVKNPKFNKIEGHVKLNAMLKKIKESKLKLIRNSSKKTEKNFNRKQKPKTKNNTGQIIGESKLSKLISL